jgi:hypothetical protein
MKTRANASSESVRSSDRGDGVHSPEESDASGGVDLPQTPSERRSLDREFDGRGRSPCRRNPPRRSAPSKRAKQCSQALCASINCPCAGPQAKRERRPSPEADVMASLEKAMQELHCKIEAIILADRRNRMGSRYGPQQDTNSPSCPSCARCDQNDRSKVGGKTESCAGEGEGAGSSEPKGRGLGGEPMKLRSGRVIHT